MRSCNFKLVELFTIVLLFARIGLVHSSETLRVAIITESLPSPNYANLEATIIQLRSKILHAAYVSLGAKYADFMPQFVFDVQPFSLKTVCDLLAVGAHVIISLTACEESEAIAHIAEARAVPHIAILRTICRNGDPLPHYEYTSWIAPDAELYTAALYNILQMEKVYDVAVATDGPSVIINKVLTMATEDTYDERYFMRFNTHHYTLHNDTPGQHTPFDKLLEYWHQHMKSELGQQKNHYILMTENRRPTEELKMAIQQNLVQEQMYWILGGLSDVTPGELRNILSKYMQKTPNDFERRPNVGWFRQFPAVEYQDCYRNIEDDLLRLFVAQVFECKLDLYTEPEVLVTYLIYVTSREYTKMIAKDNVEWARTFVGCTGPLNTSLLLPRIYLHINIARHLKRARLNDVVWFWATCASLTYRTFELHGTVKTSRDGVSRLTHEGQQVLEKTQFSGVFPNRFSNLRNATLRIGAVMDAPIIVHGWVDENFEIHDAQGMGPDLLEYLTERFNFRYKLYAPPDGEYGVLDSNNNWTGLIGELTKGKVDMAVAMLTITRERSNAVQFLGSFLNSYMSTLIRYPALETKAFQMYEPYDIHTWILTCICILATGVILYLYNRFSPFSAWNLQLPGAISDEVSFVENMWCSLRCMLLQTNELFPLAFSTRTLILFFWFLIVIWHASWQATMTAFFSKRNMIIPVRTLKDIAQQNKIRPIAMKGSTIYEFFQKADDDPVYSRIYQMMLEDNITVYSTEEGLDALRKNPNLALISDRFLLQSAVTGNCGQFILLDEAIEETPASFAVVEGAGYAAGFTDYLEALASRGIVERLFKKWLPQLEVCNVNQPEYSPLTLEDTGGGFVPIVVGILFGVIALGFEYCWRKYRSRFVTAPKIEVSSASAESTVTDRNPIRPPLPFIIADGLRFGGRRRSSTVFDAEAITEIPVHRTRL